LLLKSFESVKVTVCGISLVSGNQEDVGVRNSASPCVQGNKLGREGLHDPPGSVSRQAEEVGGLIRGQLVPPGHMAPRDDQAMPLGQRVDVEKGEGEIILKNGSEPAHRLKQYGKRRSRIFRRPWVHLRSFKVA